MMAASNRKIPRIMARMKCRRADDSSDSRSDVEGAAFTESCMNVAPRVKDELAQELNSEKFVVRDGMVVAVQHVDTKNKVVTGYLGPSTSKMGRHIIIEAGGPSSPVEAYTENPLPGVADEIESYPCKLCPDQVFLTEFGLERHGRQHHRDRFTEVLLHIQTIRDEWVRRERERSRLRERHQMAKLRQESIANAAIRSASTLQLTSNEVGEVQHVREINQLNPCDDGPDRFEACRTCSMLINAKNPMAMESHLRAHKKNDELKAQMLAELGPEIVARLTCHECKLVFTDDVKLQQHHDLTHVRKRKFVCKWCGHLCSSMAELNLHKSDVHAMSPYSMQRKPSRSRIGWSMQDHQLRHEPRQQPASSADNVCGTSCKECGLRLTKPSLLIRHMLRVHSKDTFYCELNTPDLPPIKIDMVHGRITWGCCEHKFSDRHELLAHRREEHLASLSPSSPADEKLNAVQINQPDLLEVACSDLALEPGSTAYSGQLVQGEDGSMQVIIPEGVDTDGEYTIVVVNDDDDRIKREQTSQPTIQQPSTIEIQGVANGESVTLTEEQFQQLREQFGDDLSNMQIMFVSEEDEEQEEMMDNNSESGNYADNQHAELSNDDIFEPLDE